MVTAAAPTAAELRLRCAGAAELLWSEWDGAYVLYHRPSGKTHFPNAATALLLAEILFVAKTPDAAVDELLALQSAAAQAGQREQVMALLARLETLGLIERL